MRKIAMKRLIAVLALASAAAPGWAAQDASKAERVIGAVTAPIKDQKISVKTDQGAEVTVVLQEKTIYLKVPPGEKDLKKATRITINEIRQGDRIYARGQMSEDKKSIAAASVILMSQEDLAQKHEKERAEWQARGIGGKITALDPATKEFTVAMRAREGQKNVVVGPTDAARFRRYSADSVRFDDAKPSTFSELKVGDQVRILGDKSEDGARMKPEEVVSGTFRNVAGTVKTVDVAKGEILITDLEAKKPLTVEVTPETLLRKIPERMAAFMARGMQGGTGAAGSGRPAGSGGPPSGGTGAAGGARPGGGDMTQMLEQMPPMPLTELKPGDAIIISTTAGKEPARVTAITLVAGVEPFLTAAPSGGLQIGGGWNFGGMGEPQ